MFEQKYKQLIKEMNELRYHESLLHLLMWDRENNLPPKGAAYRQKMFGYFYGKLTQCLATPSSMELVKYFSDADLSGKTDTEKGLIRYYIYMFNRCTKVPLEVQVALATAMEKGGRAWVEAKKASDYSIFKPALTELVEVSKKYSHHFDSTVHPLEPLVNNWDEGMKIDAIDSVFTNLKTELSPLIKKIAASGVQFDTSCIEQSFTKEEMHPFVTNMVEQMGYDSTAGAYGVAHHPFASMQGPKDSRINLNYRNYNHCVMSAIHEAGHGIYGQTTNDELSDLGLYGGIFGAFHEGQARFYENMIGKSREFWQHFYPLAQKAFKQFENVNFDTYYKAINTVKPTLIRMEADEITYSLHPIIRFEIEKELFEGKISIDNLPNVWNDKYEEYLGVRPQNDAEGILQDVHWSQGQFGYFQSYTLGNVQVGQINNTLKQQVPNAYSEIAKGNFKPLNDWLYENIHQYGRLYTADDMMVKVTGEPLNAKYYIDYLKDKFLNLYGIM